MFFVFLCTLWLFNLAMENDPLIDDENDDVQAL